MTLAIAVQYPYGKLARAFHSLAQIRDIRYPEAIIFVSDSRWSYNNPIMYEDIGAKIWDINNNTIVSYSGDVKVAELCIEEFKKKVNNPNVRSFSATGTFQHIYKYHQKSDPSVKRLLLLLGSYLVNKGARLVYLESPNFRPINITGVKGIGNKEAFNDVIKEVEPKINDPSLYTGTEKDYFTVAMYFVDAMRRLAVQNADYKDIGGPIQCRILDCNGITTPSISFTSDPTGKTDEWHHATVKSGEITTFRKRWNLKVNYLNSRSFGLYSYCD